MGRVYSHSCRQFYLQMFGAQKHRVRVKDGRGRSIRGCEDELKGGKMVFVLILMGKAPGGRQRRVFDK